jgi:hypothetical protein
MFGKCCWHSRSPEFMPAIDHARIARSAELSSAIGTVDVWDIAHDDTPDPATGVRGAKVGTLTDGQGMVLDQPCSNGWCRVNSGFIPRGYGFVEQNQIRFD